VDSFLSGVIAGYGIAIPVGAIAVLIVETGIRCGFRCAASAGAGAATADLFYAAVAAAGGAGIASIVRSIDEPLRYVSALVLVAIAVVGLRRAMRPPARPASSVIPSREELFVTYGRFLGLTIINPATVAYFAAIVIGLGIAADLTVGDGLLFVAGAFVASLSWQTLLAAVGSVARHRLSTRIQRAAMVGGNLLVLAMAAVVLAR
jgi:arginine exporter protein ArgO